MTAGPGLWKEAGGWGKVRVTAEIGPKATESRELVSTGGSETSSQAEEVGKQSHQALGDALKAFVLQGEVAHCKGKARFGGHHELSGTPQTSFTWSQLALPP